MLQPTRPRAIASSVAPLFLVTALLAPSMAMAVDSDPGGAAPGLVNGNPNLPKGDPTAHVDSNTGAFPTSVKIETPSYRGTAPQIELIYSSAAGNGFVAKGWRLSAESYIDRVSPGQGTPRYDGGIFCGAGSDTFALDGLELVDSTSMGGDYAGRTQTYQRIERNGTCTFKVYEKSGLKKTYKTHIHESDPDTTFRWALKYVDDPHGTQNRVEYFYTGSTTGSPERYLDRIEYGPYRIKFYRESRNDSYFLSTGKNIAEYNERLSYIRIEENMGGSYTLIRRYDLSHSYSTMSGTSRLDHVRVYGSDNSTQLPDTAFTYFDDSSQGGRFTIRSPNYPTLADLPIKASAAGTDWLTGDFNGDGRTDLFHYPSSSLNDDDQYEIWLAQEQIGNFSEHYTETYSGLKGGSWVAGDFNGDGKTDVLHAGFDASQSRVWISQGTNFDTSGRLKQTDGTSGYPNMNQGRWQSGDFNGDGRADLFHAGNLSRADVWLADPGGSFSHHQQLDFDDGFKANRAVTFPVDVNGDGNTDIVQIPIVLDKVLVYLANQDGTLADPVDIASPPGYSADLWAGAWAAGDFNGDGLTDLAHGAEEDYLFTWFSNGDGTFNVVEEYANNYSPRVLDGSLIGTDLDGDGKDDLIHIADDDRLWLWYSAGDGDYSRKFRVANYSPVLWNSSNHGGHWHSGDFDGDGVPDLLHAFYNDSTQSRVRLWTGTRNDYGDLLKKVVGVYGAEDELTYRTTTGLARSYLPPGLVLPLVDTLTQNDGRATGNETRWTYSYDDGDWSSSERCFLGFGTVSIDDDSDGMVTTTDYIQNASCIIQPDTIIRTSGSTPLFKTDYDYVGNHSSPPYTSLVDSAERYVYAGSENINQLTTTEFAYTTHGEQKEIKEWGLSTGAVNDQRLTVRRFATAGSSYVVNAPYQVDVYEETSENPANLASSTRFYYDDETTLIRSVSVGDLTEEVGWDSDIAGYTRTTSRVYDSYGNLIRSQRPGNVAQSIDYDAENLFPVEECGVWIGGTKSYCTEKTWDYKFQKVATATDLNLEVTSTYYDVLGRIDYVTSPDPSAASGTVTTDYDYSNIGNPDSQFFETVLPDEGDGLEQRTYFDGLGRTWQETWEGTRQRDTHYIDTEGRVWKQSFWYDNGAESPQWTEYSYDAHRRVSEIRHPSFSGDGVATAEIDYGIAGGWLWERRYRASYSSETVEPKTIWRDGLGRIVQIDLVDGATTYPSLYGYGANDRLESVLQYGDAWSFTWNSLGELRASTDPDRGSRAYAYYLDGLVQTATDAKSQVTTWEYDELRRQTLRTDNDGTETSWEYDSLPGGDPDQGTFSFEKSVGKLVRASYASGRELHNWHRSGLESQSMRCVDGNCQTMQFAYDDAGRIGTITYPDSEAVTYAYDSLGNLNSVGDPVVGIVTNVDWSPRSRESDQQYTRLEFVNGAVAVYDRSPERRWLNSVTVNVGAGPDFYQASYGYYGDGTVERITSTTHDRWNSSYLYDDMQRLTTVTPLGVNPEPVQSFTYDPNGNIASNSKLTGNYTYDPAHLHAVRSAGGTTYEYDANGSQLSATVRSPACVEVSRLLTYNVLDEVAWASSGAATFSFAYDGEGQRIRKLGPGGTTRYFGRYLETEDDGSTTATTKFYYAGDLLLAKDRDGVRSYYHSNHLSSPQLITDSAGVAAASYEYAAFGEILNSTEAAGVENHRTFGGHESDDEFGLVYMGARYYDPILGRFASADSVAPNLMEPQGWNPYSFVQNNPMSYSDPSGNILETAVDVLSLAAGIHAISQWNAGTSLLTKVFDVGGVVADGIAAAIPVLPGGVGLGIKAVREGAEQTVKHGDDVVETAAKFGDKLGSGADEAVDAAGGSATRGADDLLDAAGGVVKNERKGGVFAPGGRERAKELFREFDAKGPGNRNIVRERDGSRAVVGELSDKTPLRIRLKKNGTTRLQVGKRKVQFNDKE